MPELRSRGLYDRGSVRGFFDIHRRARGAFSRIIALSSCSLRLYPTRDENKILKRRSIAEVVGWYWHFMDGVWIALFLLLGFWR